MPEPRKEGERPPNAGDAAAFIDRIVKDPKAPPKTLLLVGYLGRSSEEGHTRLYLDPELGDYVEIPNDAILHAERSGEDSPLAASFVWIQRSADVVHGEAGGTRYRAGFLEGRITQDYMGGAAGGVAGGAGGAAAFGPVTIPFPVCFPTRFPPLCPPPSYPIWRCPTRVLPLCRSIPILTCPTQHPILCRPTIIRCPPPSVLQICPSVAIRCPTQPIVCSGPSALTICPSVAVRCPTLAAGCVNSAVAGCVNSAVVTCPTLGACPSAVDGCPSAPGGCTFDITIYQGTVVQGTVAANPGMAAGQFADQYGMGAEMGGYGF
jgi:hypothetical protein